MALDGISTSLEGVLIINSWDWDSRWNTCPNYQYLLFAVNIIVVRIWMQWSIFNFTCSWDDTANLNVFWKNWYLEFFMKKFPEKTNPNIYLTVTGFVTSPLATKIPTIASLSSDVL